MLIFTRMISSAGRGFPQWVELRCDDMDRLHPLCPLPPAVSGQRPASRVPAAAAGAGRAEAHGVGRGAYFPTVYYSLSCPARQPISVRLIVIDS